MKWFNDLKIGTKLILSFAVVSAITAFVGYEGITKMQEIDELAEEMYQRELLGLSYIKEANVDLIDIGRAEKNFLLASSAADREKYRTVINKDKEALHRNLEAAKPLLSTDQARDAFARTEEAWKEREAVLQKILETAEKEDFQKDRESVALAMGIGKQKADAVDELLSQVAKLKEENAKKTADLTTEIYHSSRQFLIVLAVGAVLAALGLGFFIARIISKPVQQIAAKLEELRSRCITNLTNGVSAMARGDLSLKVEAVTQPLAIDSRDEVGALARTFDTMLSQTQNTIHSYEEVRGAVNNLLTETERLIGSALAGQLAERGQDEKFLGGYRQLVSGINKTLDAVIEPVNEATRVLERVAAKDLTARIQSDFKGDHAKIKNALNTAVENLEEALSQVAVGAEQVTSAAGQISTGSQTLAQGASEQASSIEEISSSLQETASMTKANAANAKEARGLSDGTRSSTERGVNSMKRLSTAINKIKASADATAKIVKTIDEIAFQTNLLALNAAVEAARAGDAGKGFAVVAEEVRNLAMRSAEAAKNTANLIEESVSNAEGGVAINEEVLRNLDEINEQVKKVSEVMSEIAAASDQQSQGVEQINTGIDQMNQVTQQMAANSEESASAAEELSSQAAEMLNMVSTFRLSQTGNSTARFQHKAPQAPARPAQTFKPAVAAKPTAKINGGSKPLIPFTDDMDTAALRDF